MSAIEELMNMSVEERTKLRWNDPRLDVVAENTGLRDGRVSPSENDSTARSPKGAQGIMQFMPATMELQGGMFRHNPLDPVESLEAAAKYLSFTLTNQYKGNVAAAIADYNRGPTQAQIVVEGRMPTAAETRDYLTKVTHFFETFTNVPKNTQVAAAPPKQAPPPAPVATPTPSPAPTPVVAVQPRQERVLRYDAGGRRIPSIAEK